jgi:hypothetical protein
MPGWILGRMAPYSGGYCRGELDYRSPSPPRPRFLNVAYEIIKLESKQLCLVSDLPASSDLAPVCALVGLLLLMRRIGVMAAKCRAEVNERWWLPSKSLGPACDKQICARACTVLYRQRRVDAKRVSQARLLSLPGADPVTKRQTFWSSVNVEITLDVCPYGLTPISRFVTRDRYPKLPIYYRRKTRAMAMDAANAAEQVGYDG